MYGGCLLRPLYPLSVFLKLFFFREYDILQFFRMTISMSLFKKNKEKEYRERRKSVLFAWFASHQHNLSFNSVPSSRTPLIAS